MSVLEDFVEVIGVELFECALGAKVRSLWWLKDKK